MKHLIVVLVIVLSLCGCKSGSPSGDNAAAESTKPRIYELADVDKEMKEAGIQLNSSREDLRNFFRTHPTYQVCQDTEQMLIARMRNSKIDPKLHDQYISAVYRDGKIFNLEVGPPEFSVANLPSYCH